MSNEIIKSAIGKMIPMITERLKEALTIANTASACVATGNPEAALRVMMDIEESTTEVATLFNAACILKRELTE
jgi:hypothetical protein